MIEKGTVWVWDAVVPVPEGWEPFGWESVYGGGNGLKVMSHRVVGIIATRDHDYPPKVETND